MYFTALDAMGSSALASKNTDLLDAECVKEIHAYISKGRHSSLADEPPKDITIVSPTLTPPQTPLDAAPPRLRRIEPPVFAPRRAYRTPMETRRRLGWIIDEPLPGLPPRVQRAEAKQSTQSIVCDVVPVASSVEGISDMLSVFTLLMVINVFGPCCFIYAGLCVVFMALSRRSPV